VGVNGDKGNDMSSSSIYIVEAKRTPQGRFLGKLAGYSALDLGVHTATAVLQQIGVDKVDLTIVGNVLPPFCNVARQISLKTGIRQESPAYTVNMVCASGLHALTLACDAVRLGHASVVLCGGTESMSNAPHLVNGARQGFRLTNAVMEDSLLIGLSDPVIGETMTHTAERLAKECGISREQQDAFALRSHQSAVAGWDRGAFDKEVVALGELTRDEHPRADTTLERLGKLKTVLGADGTVTAGNASGINDAAAMLVVCNADALKRYGWQPLAEVEAYTYTGCDPKTMGLGPVFATRKLIQQYGVKLNELDVIEINEAFAAQVLACAQQLGISDDPRLNPNGGGISMGHPVGASGARLAVHLAHRIATGEINRGLATLCVGGGQGIAAVLKKPVV
jgi:acetyl-CoA C-acetyltransferase